MPRPTARQAAAAATAATAPSAQFRLGSLMTAARGSARAPSMIRSRSSLRRDRPFGRVGQGRDGLAKQRKLLGALLAVREVPLETLALVVVERVERVGG